MWEAAPTWRGKVNLSIHHIMKKFIISLGAVAALATSMSAHADVIGKIVAIQADNADNGENLGFKFVPATGSTLPACATGVLANAFIYAASGANVGAGTDVARNFAGEAVFAAYTGAKTVRLVVPGVFCDAKGRLYAQGIVLQ
jgi:hypothetical protein